MKKYIKYILLFVCLLGVDTTWAQSSRSPIEDMVNAVENAHVTDMVKYFDSYVNITINNLPAIYSRNQAEIVMRDFFEKNPPKTFDVTDNGSPDNNSKFIIAILTTSTGIKYNTYILMKMKDGAFMLQQMSINKQL
jgi:hypothetical protein